MPAWVPEAGVAASNIGLAGYDLLANAPASGADKVLWVATDQGLRQWQGGVLNPVGPQEADITSLQAQVTALGSPISPNVADGVLSANDAASDFVLTLLLDKHIDPAASIQTQKLSWTTQSVSTNTTLVDKSAVVVKVDTTAGPITVTLPAAPSAGTMFIFWDTSAMWATNNLTINRNGKQIDAISANPVLNETGGVWGIIYAGTWRTVISNPGKTVPVIDGTAAAGTSKAYTPIDHVHPTDTTRASTSHHTTHHPNGSDAVDWTGTIHMSGVEGSLPAAAAANAGSLYYATDTFVLFRSSGSVWTPISWPGAIPGQIGALSNQPINDITLSNIAMSASGTDQLVGIFIPKGYVVSNIRARIGATPATLGSNNDSHWYMVIRKQDGTLQASSADQATTAITANLNINKAIARDSANAAAATWTSPASDYYLAGINIYLGTGGAPVMPTLCGKAAINNSTINNLSKIVTATGQTAMTSGTPATSASPAVATVQPFVWVS